MAALGIKAKGYRSDASDYQQAEDLMNQVVADFGKIDVLVNNAGITKDGLLMRMTEEQWDTVIQVNLKSVFNLTKAATKPMMKDQLGLISQNVYQLGNSYVSVVPQDGFDPPDHPAARRQHATKLQLALYWLERDGCLQLCGTIPNLLTISIHRPTLVS